MFDLFDLIADSLNGTAELLTTLRSCLPLLLFAALYVLQGISLTFLCRAARKGSVWMAWVPFANLYLLGLMADVYTDDRVLRGEVSPDYAPSTLRRKMLGYSIVERIIGGLAGAAWGLVVLSGITGFILALGAFLAGDEAAEELEFLEPILAGGIVLLLAAGTVFIVFHILYLVAACKAYYRLFRMLDSRVPALWSASAVFIPPLATVMLFVFTVKNYRVLTEKFFPPMEPMETTADEAADGETPPPDEPPMPELYQL